MFAASVTVCLHGTVAHGLLEQPVWEPQGWIRLLWFSAVYAGMAAIVCLLRPVWTIPSLAVAAALFTGVAAGLPALSGVVWAALGSWACGWLLWPRTGASLATPVAIQITLGLAAWATLVMWTAAVPVHFRAVYWLMPALFVAAAWRRGWRPRIRIVPAQGRAAAAAWAVGLFPLFAHWLVVLLPEVSADGLAMHMVIPARMGWAHRWPFDVKEFAWAVMPMGGDWVWTIGWQLGGEAAARLMNLLLLILITWITMARASRRLPVWTTALLAAAMLTTPLVQHVTGSLFVENATALWLVAAVLVLVETRLEPGRARIAFGVLAGMAAATKFGALAFLGPLLVAGLLIAGWRAMLTATMWLFLIGATPYVNAWLRTGNPVFPFLNAVFRSPLWAPVNIRDTRFETPPGWTTLYDLVLHSSRFIEGFDGAAGFFVLPALAAVLTAWRREWPQTRSALLFMALAGGLLSYAGQSNLRYLYPVLPLTALLGAEVLAEAGLERRWARWAVVGGLAVICVLQLRLLPAAGYYHREFYVSRWWQPRQDEAYLVDHAPERKLVEWLNTHAPQARAAWFWGNAVGDFRGRAWTASWHSPEFWNRFRSAAGAEQLEKLLMELGVQYVLATTPEGRRIAHSVYERQFLDQCMERVLVAGDMELRRWPEGRGCWTGEPPAAQPGVHDDTSPSLRFSGAWIRDMQFPQTHGGTLVYTNGRQAEARLRFRGSAARLMYTAAFNRCAAAVEIDGAPAGGFDQRSRQTQWQQWSPWFAAPEGGEHTLTLRIAAGSPEGCWLDLDAFEVRQGP